MISFLINMVQIISLHTFEQMGKRKNVILYSITQNKSLHPISCQQLNHKPKLQRLQQLKLMF
ncbi:hypothetical protein Hanom_Chr03g00262781 [Helianthus anomalus]